MSTTQLFISYSRADHTFVEQLHQALAGRDRDIWIDLKDIRTFEPDWRATTFGAIETCGTLLFVLSPASVESSICAQEIAHAAQHGKRLAVIVYQPVADRTVKERLPWLEVPQWLHFTADGSFEQWIDRLVDGIDTDLEHLTAHTRIYRRAREWETSADDSFLLRGADLRAAETWLETSATKSPAVTALHERYVRESRKSVVRVVSAAVSGEAELAENADDLTASALLAIEAYRLAPSPQIERLLRGALRIPRPVLAIPPEKATFVPRPEVSEDGSRVAVARGNRATIVEIPTGREIASFEHETPVRSMKFSPTGRYLATWINTSDDRMWEEGPIAIWNVAESRIAAQGDSGGRVAAFEFDRSERYAAAGTSYDRAVVFDLTTGHIRRLKHRDAVVSALAFDATGTQLAAGQAGATRVKGGWSVPFANDLWVWNVKRWRPAAYIRETGEVDLLAFSPEGQHLVGACSRGSRYIVVWKRRRLLGLTRFREVGRLELRKRINAIAFDPEFWWMFAIACEDGVVRIVEFTIKADRYQVGESYRLTLSGGANCVAFIPLDERGRRPRNVVAAGGDDRTVREWYGVTEVTRAYHPSAVERVRYSADRRFLVVGVAGGGVYVWASNHDSPEAKDVPAESLVDEVASRVTRNLTQAEWRRAFGDEPYRRTIDHLPDAADR